VSLFADFPADVPVLQGGLVRLEPLSSRHSADLAVAAEEDRESYGFTGVPRASEMDDYLTERSERARNGGMVPFAQVRLGDGRAVGVTTYHDPRFWPGRPGELCAVEIGGTWLAASAQRTGINIEAKFLLLEYAFETLQVVRADLKTDARNERSRRAIGGLGAKFEGVLRNWSPSHVPGEDGLLRDSAMFSVIAPEWPSVKAALRARFPLDEAPHRDRAGGAAE
jgi:RimJ/RimL family protein N-acetyltransferase